MKVFHLSLYIRLQRYTNYRLIFELQLQKGVFKSIATPDLTQNSTPTNFRPGSKLVLSSSFRNENFWVMSSKNPMLPTRLASPPCKPGQARANPRKGGVKSSPSAHYGLWFAQRGKQGAVLDIFPNCMKSLHFISYLLTTF